MLEIYCVKTQRASEHRDVRALLALAWREHGAGPMPEIVYEDGGRPRFASGPLFFSLSHSRTLAVCALSDREVGADAETVRPVRPALPRRILPEEELRWMERQPGPDRAFLALWTAREAWAKRTGRGLGSIFPRISLRERIENEGLFFEVRAVRDCIVTVCTDRGEAARWTVLDALPAEG